MDYKKPIQSPAIVTGNGRDLRKLMRNLTENGAETRVDRHDHKVMSRGDCYVLMAVKNRAGWDIRVCASVIHHIYS